MPYVNSYCYPVILMNALFDCAGWWF